MQVTNARSSLGTAIELTLAWIALTSQAIQAQDRAVIQKPGGSRFVVPGYVEDYTGQNLIMQIRQGEAPRRYPREDVIEVQTNYTAHHEKGRRLFAEGRINDAKLEFAAALNDEDRKWVRREILSQLTRCSLWTGDYRSAATSFLPIVETDPETIHFGVAPLAWVVGDSSEIIKLDARKWFAEKPLATKLIGASYLLFDRELHDDAETTLRRLARDPGVKLARLAQMQLWRVRSADGSATPSEIARWEATIEESPDDLRGGGYFVLGQTYRRLQEPERSAAALLWLPMVYNSDRHLAARACFEAAEQIESFGDTAQATNLYSEVVFRYSDTSLATRAEAKWQTLRKGVKSDR